MPNWMYNTMDVSGRSDHLDLFEERAMQPYSRLVDKFTEGGIKQVWETREEALSFWNFLKPEDEDWYNTDSNWYEWNNENWGTKWEANDVDAMRHSETDLTYHFATAWSYPEPLMEAMVAQFPKLTFEFYCEEEQGWGAEFVGSAGKLIKTKSWDVPNSHADFVALGKPLTCNCAFDDDQRNWFDDCPRSEPTEKDLLAEKIRQQIIAGSGVSDEWADKHLKVII